MMWTIKNKKI